MRRCSASAQVAEARRRAPGSCPSPRCGPGPPRRVFAASSAAAPDRSALCDFFDSQRGLAPPRPSLRRARAAGGLRGLGGRLLTGPRFLETPDTRHEAAAGPSGRHGFSPRGRARGADAAQRGSGALEEEILRRSYSPKGRLRPDSDLSPRRHDAVGYNSGVALRRRRRLDGVRVGGSRRPTPSERRATQRRRLVPFAVAARDPRACLRCSDRRHAVDASTGVRWPRQTGGGPPRASYEEFHQSRRKPRPARPERPQKSKRNHPRPSFLETTRPSDMNYSEAPERRRIRHRSIAHAREPSPRQAHSSQLRPGAPKAPA